MKILNRRAFIKSALAMTTLPLISNAKELDTNKNIKFIHITDSHMDISDADSVEAMELMVFFINEDYKDLDFVLFGGDNFNNNVKGDEDARKFKYIIDKLHCPALVVRGNKESSPKPQDGIDLDAFKEIFMQEKGLNIDGKNWSYEKNGYVILGLDSCIENANNGLYTEETMKFAESVLRTNKPTVVLNHHPYTNYWNSTDAKDIKKYVLGNTDEVQKRLFKYENLLLTLSGHKHIDSVKEINKTKVIVTRGFVRPLDLDMYPMRYVEIDGTKINEKLIYTS